MSRQFGLIHRDQARAAEMPTHTIDNLLRRGIWERFLPSVYSSPVVGGSWEQRVMGGQLWGNAHCAVSHRTAAVLHGFDGFHKGIVELSLAKSRNSPARWLVLHSTQRMREADLEMKGSFRCTSPTRTVLDLAGIIHEELLEIALDSALRSGQTSLKALASSLEALGGKGRRGAALLERLLRVRQGIGLPETPIETLYARIERKYGLPTAIRQFRIAIAGRRRRIDFAYPDRRLGIEIDGRKGHTGFANEVADWTRQVEFAANGWTILHFTRYHLVHYPEWVAQQVMSAYERLEPQGGFDLH